MQFGLGIIETFFFVHYYVFHNPRDCRGISSWDTASMSSPMGHPTIKSVRHCEPFRNGDAEWKIPKIVFPLSKRLVTQCTSRAKH